MSDWFERSIDWLCRLAPAAGFNPVGLPCMACHRFDSEVSLSIWEMHSAEIRVIRMPAQHREQGVVS
jgi:hypothetical protein